MKLKSLRARLIDFVVTNVASLIAIVPLGLMLRFTPDRVVYEWRQTLGPVVFWGLATLVVATGVGLMLILRAGLLRLFRPRSETVT